MLAAPALAQAPPVGEARLSAKEALAHFRAACLDTHPGHAGAVAVLKAEGFAPNPGTPTWYHPSLDLSVQVDGECSMIFRSAEPPEALALAIATDAAVGGTSAVRLDPATGVTSAVGPGGSEFTFEAFAATGEDSYFRAALWPPR